jgi:hypothetical protein
VPAGGTNRQSQILSHLTDHETYLARAEAARAEADAATLENVKERCLRSEAAWMEMAERAERALKMRATLLSEKMSSDPT